MKLAKSVRVIFSVLLCAVFTLAAEPTLPDTAPARLFAGWLKVFNDGDAAKLAAFIEQHYSAAEKGGHSAAEKAERELDFRQRVGGGFDIYKVEESTPASIRLLLRQRDGQGWGEAVFQVDPAAPELIAKTDLHPAEAPPEAQPARMDDAQLRTELQKQLQKLTEGDLFSGTVLVARHGKVIYEGAYGFADREKKIKNTLDTKFQIGSMNKMFTAVAIAQLVEKGKLHYSDTVAQLLPDYPNQEIAKKITLGQILSHTSGLDDYFGPEYEAKKDHLVALKDYLPLFAKQPLLFEPGQGWRYSNAGMLVAGLIVEKVSGQDYFDYVREHIYKPAGMKDSDHFLRDRMPAKHAIGYTHEESASWEPTTKTLGMRGTSAGGGSSTVHDLLRFAEALQSGKLLKSESVKEITSGKHATPFGGEYGYGFEDNIVDGHHVTGHNGGAPGMNGNLDMCFDDGVTVVVLSNLDPPSAQNVARWISERVRF